jgi:hypothetical protein
MAINILTIKDSEKYAGKYVATKSFQDNEVVTSGESLIEVHKAAKAKGVSDPVIFYVKPSRKDFLKN